MMKNIEDIQKELQQMGDHFQRLQDSVAQLAKEQAQTKKGQTGENKEAFFASAERKGAAYPLEGHVMGQVDPKAKEAYVSLLLFAWSLLQPEAKEADDGLVTVARIRELLHVDTPLYHLFCHMKETAGAELEMWFQKVDQSGGKSAYLLDTLILCQEMKAESDASYGKLSQLYLFMGCKESMLKEAAEAVQLIQERNRYKYLLCENHKWKSFEGRTGECYLNLVGDLNTPGQVAPASYYALWPERPEGATGVSKYAPKVMLKIEVAEGAMVEKGQTLFTVYGAKESLKRGFFFDPDHSITYNGTSAWGYVVWKCYWHVKDVEGGRWGYLSKEDEQKRLEDCLLNSYEILSVKADRDGIVHWQSCVNMEPFVCMKSISYYVSKKEPPIDLQPDDTFISSESMTPSTIGKMPICVVEKM